MKIYSFNKLSEDQKRNIYQSAKAVASRGSFDSYEEMVKFYEGTDFDNGRSHFSLWEENRLLGTLGVITKAAAIRGEIFLIAICFREADSSKLALLISKAFDYCSDIKGACYKLGITHGRYYLIPTVEKSGFREVYRYLEMKYSGSGIILPPEVSECCRSLSSDNIRDFQRVHNAAFLLAPNGSAIEDSELQEYLDEYGGSSLAGIYYQDDNAAGVYILKLDGTDGYIEGIGVAPEFHGKGIGKKLLLKSISVLQDSGAEKVELSVFNNNTRAVELYLKNGFEEERELSIWFER